MPIAPRVPKCPFAISSQYPSCLQVAARRGSLGSGSPSAIHTLTLAQLARVLGLVPRVLDCSRRARDEPEPSRAASSTALFIASVCIIGPQSISWAPAAAADEIAPTMATNFQRATGRFRSGECTSLGWASKAPKRAAITRACTSPDALRPRTVCVAPSRFACRSPPLTMRGRSPTRIASVPGSLSSRGPEIDERSAFDVDWQVQPLTVGSDASRREAIDTCAYDRAARDRATDRTTDGGRHLQLAAEDFYALRGDAAVRMLLYRPKLTRQGAFDQASQGSRIDLDRHR